METFSPRPLAVESFSDSWLSNVRPSLINVLELENHDFVQSTSSNSFDFDTPIRFHHDNDQCDHDNHIKFVPADEIFSNGLIKPGFVGPSRDFSSASFEDFGVSPLSYVSSSASESRNRVISDTNDAQMGCSCSLFRRQRRRVLLEKILQRLFGFLRRTRWQKSKKSSTKVDDIDRRTMEVTKSFNNSPQTSPCSSSVYCDVESSINEAVLHCKRSIGR